MPVGDQLTIHAAQACNFCCNIGSHFNPDLTSVSLSQGDNGPYTAESVATGQYNTSDSGTACDPSAQRPTATAKSVQITP
jgi:hypothetical protein